MSFDVIVVGAGVVGSSTALALSKRGKRVLLLEQFESLHKNGSSHGGSRITRRLYLQKHFAEMMTQAYPLWESIIKESGVNFFRPTGGLNVGLKKGTKIEEIIRHARSVGAPIEVINAAQIKERYGLTFSDDYLGVVDQDAGVLEATNAVRAIQSLFLKRGGVLLDNSKVIQVIPGATVSIVTALKTYTAPTVVLVPGSWASTLFATLGVQLNVQVEEISVCYWKTSSPRYELSNKFPVLLDYGFERFVYVLPAHEYPGLVKICGHTGTVIAPGQRTYTRNNNVVGFLREYVRTHFPDVDATEPAKLESCVYTNTVNEDFLLDSHPQFPNIILSSACSGHGFKLGPIVGEVLADLATKSAAKFDMTPFKLGNFLLPSAKL